MENDVQIHIDKLQMDDVHTMTLQKSAEWVVYILRSVTSPMRTYAGATNNIIRRIRQHNGELAGGAVATKTTRPWKIHALVYGFQNDKCRALRCEWFTKIKHYKGTLPGSNGIDKRMFLLKYAMEKCRNGPELRAIVVDSPKIQDCLDVNAAPKLSVVDMSPLYCNKTCFKKT